MDLRKLKTKEEIFKEFEDKLNKYKQYTHEELSKFQELGIEGEVCMCNMKLANTMTIECIICGKVQSMYAKRFVKRK